MSYFHPGGMPAISPGVARGTRRYPRTLNGCMRDPGPGSQAFHPERKASTSGTGMSLPTGCAICSSLAFRWYRCAQPPANRFRTAFRFWGDHLHHAIMASFGRGFVKCRAIPSLRNLPGWPPLAPLSIPSKTAKNRRLIVKALWAEDIASSSWKPRISGMKLAAGKGRLA